MMTLPANIDEALCKLQQNAKTWADLPDTDRAAVARACRKQFATLSMDWEEDNLKCLGIEPSKRDAYNTAGMDPFLFIATTTERLDKIADALEGKLESFSKQEPRKVSESETVIYEMGPLGQSTPGCTLELWSAKNGAAAAEDSACDRGASIVLGAGNQNFLTSVDVIERAFIHKECVFLKHHPIRPFIAPAFMHIFEPLMKAGAFAQCLDSELGGAHEAFICHKSVSHVHMTGSGATHDRIAASLKKAGRTQVGFTSELGCVSPWIICPGTGSNGQWEKAAIDHHTTMLTSAFKSSCSMNCLSPKVLVLPTQEVWPQRGEFLEALRQRMSVAPDMPPYYPGAHKRYDDFVKAYPSHAAEKIEAPPTQPVEDAPKTAAYPGQDFKMLPSLLVDVGTIGTDDFKPYALKNEAFAPVLAIASVACSSAEEFPLAAAKAMNKEAFGNLSCALIYPDERSEALDKVVQELEYGCVGINVWPALGYSNPLGVWGAFPGKYSPNDPQSGQDFVGNAAGVPSVSKGVLVSPFVNKGVGMDKPIPMLVLDSLQVLLSGKSFAVPRILGIMASRAFGLLPRRMTTSSSRATMCFQSRTD